MQVVGITTPREVFVCSKEKKFRKKELLVIEDQDGLLGEVVETQCYNRYLPLALNDSFVDAGVLSGLRSVGYNIDDEEISVAKVCLLEEAAYPVNTGCLVRTPLFNEVENLLIQTNPTNGLVLGVIKGTEEVAASGINKELQNLAYVLENKKIVEQKEVPFIFPLKDMQQYPHLGIFGGSGSGKSFGLRVILEELMKLSIPTIVFDPHFEMDFSHNFPELPSEFCKDFRQSFTIFQVGKEVGVNFEDLSVRDLCNLLGSVGSLSEHMTNAVQMLYKKKDSYLSFSSRVNDLAAALEKGNNRIEKALASGELNGNEYGQYQRYLDLLEDYKGIQMSTANAIIIRLRSLYNSGLFNHSIRLVEEAIKNRKLIVIRGPVRILQVFASYVLSNLYYQRREYRDGLLRQEMKDPFPPFVVATDEAHNFAPRGYDSATKGIIKEIAQEGRKYGVFLLLATQRPALLDETTTAQLNTKLVFRTVRSTDIATIKEETDLSPEEAKSLPYLRSGDAFISSAIWGRTVAVRIRVTKTTSLHTQNPFDELEQMYQLEEEEFFNFLQDKLPLCRDSLLHILPELNKQLGQNKTLEINSLREKLDYFVQKGKLKKESTPFGETYHLCG